MLLFLFFFVCESSLLGSLAPTNETLPTKDLMKQITADPKKFVAEMEKVDPTALAEIISLLENLLETSEGQEQDLVDKVDEETAKALQTAEDLANAATAVEDAQAALELAEQEHSAASDAHDAQEAAKALAEQELADGSGPLNGEQDVIREVIAMLKGLHAPAGWTLVYRQTHPFYQPADNWANALGAPEDDNYSVLGDLENYRGADGKFEFKLCWPQGGRLCQWWKQSNNPLEGAAHSGVQGYEGIEIHYTNNGWGGLEHGGTASLFDGTNNHGNWYYAVGSSGQWGCGIPGRSECELQAELWVHA
jgi:hypothetical protein